MISNTLSLKAARLAATTFAVQILGLAQVQAFQFLSETLKEESRNTAAIRGAESSKRFEMAMNASADLKWANKNATCIQNTGGTCMVQNCAGFRGSTTCSWGMCFCNSNACSGADGACHEEVNSELHTTFKLKNARWPNYYMYMSKFHNNVHVSKSTDDQSVFNLFALPGQPKPLQEFMLTSQKWQDYTVAVVENEHCDNSDDKQHHRDCRKYHQTEAKHIRHNSVVDLAVRIVAAPEYDGAPSDGQSLMIEGFGYPGKYLYVGRFGNQVMTYDSDPGAGGYWIAEPPLPIELVPYRGHRCSYDCGSYGSS